MKIQEMAFVLVALLILFGMVALFYLTVRVNTLKGDVNSQKEDLAREELKKLVSTAEFAFTASDCSNCVDLDKLLVLKSRKSYVGFWKFNYLAIEKVYPTSAGECNKANYPNCKTITIVNSTINTGSVGSIFVDLCRYEPDKGGYMKCELGKLLASAKVNNGI